MDQFSARDHDGDLVALRVPTREDLQCLERAGVVEGGALGLLAPVWLLRDADCDQRGSCHCQLVDLSLAVAGLTARERSLAVSAHLAVMGDVSAHLSAVTDVSAGTAPLDAVCVSCFLRTDEHLRELDAELAERARELANVATTYRIRTEVVDPRED